MKKRSLLFLLFALNAPQISQGSEPQWPTQQWQKKYYGRAGFDPNHFNDFIDSSFQESNNFQTDSIVVIKDGYLVFERHAHGYGGDKKHALWSLGKTMINALYGVMEKQGILHREDAAAKYYPMLYRPQTMGITLSHLLRMSSGFEFMEEDRDNLLQSDCWFAFYSKNSYRDMPAFIASKPILNAPGTKFNYSSGDSGLLMAVLRGAVGEADYRDYPWREFFHKLGMNSVSIERDNSDNLALHGLGYASPLDIARLGLLYLRKGVVNGESLFPEDWLPFTSQMAPAQKNLSNPRNLQNNQAYGAQIWLNKKRPQDKTLPYPELPENALMGLGTRGQVLLLLPSENIILVRTATDTELSIDSRKRYRHNFFSLFMQSLERRDK